MRVAAPRLGGRDVWPPGPGPFSEFANSHCSPKNLRLLAPDEIPSGSNSAFLGFAKNISKHPKVFFHRLAYKDPPKVVAWDCSLNVEASTRVEALSGGHCVICAEDILEAFDGILWAKLWEIIIFGVNIG